MCVCVYIFVCVYTQGCLIKDSLIILMLLDIILS